MHRSLFAAVALLAACAAVGSGCGYNSIQGQDEEVTAAWAEVLNQYQRRYDLVPNLVSTVKGYAEHERETLEAITNARAQVGQVKLSPELLNDPGAFAKFEQSQASLGSALSRLLVVAERYPDLKASQNFRDLQVQLEGTENRIAVARKRYIEAVKEYNKKVRYFPTNLTAKYLLHMEVKPTFQLEDEAVKQNPKVEF